MYLFNTLKFARILSEVRKEEELRPSEKMLRRSLIGYYEGRKITYRQAGEWCNVVKRAMKFCYII